MLLIARMKPDDGRTVLTTTPLTERRGHANGPSLRTGQRVHAGHLWSISVSGQVILGHRSCLVTRLQTREAEEDPVRSRQLVLFLLTPSPHPPPALYQAPLPPSPQRSSRRLALETRTRLTKGCTTPLRNPPRCTPEARGGTK